jgi:uncharacterized cupredoxin-like copper-binding protein
VYGSPDVARVLPDVQTTVQLLDFGFASPATLPAGPVTIMNAGKQPHEINIARLGDEDTVDDVLASLRASIGAPDVDFVGGTMGLSPGVRTTVDLDVAPGRYLFVCQIPDITDGGRRHYEKGMATEVVVGS